MTFDAAPSDALRFRRSRWELPAAVLALVAGWGILFAAWDVWVSEYWLTGVIVSVAVLARVGVSQLHRIELTATHLVIRRARRSIAVPWSRVQGFMVNDSNGSRTLEVQTDDRKQTPMPAPKQAWLTGPAAFDAAHQEIGRWWVAHRGPQWQPTSATAYQSPPDLVDHTT